MASTDYINIPIFSYPAAPGGLLYTYAAGGTTPKTTYAADGTTPNTNPVVLDTLGNATVRGSGSYHFLLKDSTGATTLWDVDNYTSNQLLTASDIGTILWPQTAAELAASITPSAYAYPPGNILRYGADLTGVADSTSAFNSAVKLGNVVVPTGSYKVTGCAVSTNDCTIVGGGAENTVITVGANNSVIFNVTAQRFKVSGIKFVGDGTTSSSTNGVAILLINAGEHVNSDCSYSGFGFGAISGTASSSLKGPQIMRAKCRGTVSAGGSEFYLGGIWTDTLIQDVDAQSATASYVLLLFDNSTTGWQGLIVRGGVSNGYSKTHWGVTDEHWDGSNRVWTAVFDGVRCIGSNWSGIKCKTSRNVKIVNCTFDGCGLAQEDQPSGLYGDVLCNSLGKVTIRGNTFRNSGSTAIKCNATIVSSYPGANPGGQAEDEWNISDNMIDTTGVVFSGTGYGIAVSNGWKGMLIKGNIMRGISNRGIYTLTSATSPFWDLGIFNNTITDSPAAVGMDISFGQSLRMDGNIVQNCGATGITISTVDDVSIGSADRVLDPAAGSGYGYQIGTTKDLNFRARAGNSTYTQWTITTGYTIGQRVFNGANVYECVVAGTSGAGAGPVATSGADTSDGTVTWYFVGKYQLMAYALRLVGTQVRIFADFDSTGCVTGPLAAITTGAGGTTITFRTSLQTTAAGAANAYTLPMPDAIAWMVEYKVGANANAVPDRAMYHLEGLYYRTGGGNVTLQGALTNISTVESNAAWDATLLASTTNLIGRMTGVAATTINWNVETTLRGIA